MSQRLFKPRGDGWNAPVDRSDEIDMEGKSPEPLDFRALGGKYYSELLTEVLEENRQRLLRAFALPAALLDGTMRK